MPFSINASLSAARCRSPAFLCSNAIVASLSLKLLVCISSNQGWQRMKSNRSLTVRLSSGSSSAAEEKAAAGDLCRRHPLWAGV